MAKITGKLLGWVGYTTGLGTNSWHDDNDANLRKIDALLQANATKVMSPPGSPTDGSVYLIDVGATSGWSGKDNYLARWSASLNAWEYFAPSVGWRVVVGGVDHRWSGTAWVAQSLQNVGTLNTLPRFGSTSLVDSAVTDDGSAVKSSRRIVVGTTASAGSGRLDIQGNDSASGYADINWYSGLAANPNRRITGRWEESTKSLVFFSSDDAGAALSNRLRIYQDNATPVRAYLGLDVASGGFQIGGVETISSARDARLGGLRVIKSLGATISAATRIDLTNNDETWGQSFWSDSGGNLRLAFLQGDATWTDRFTLGRNGNLNILSGSLQINAVDAITSAREGRFTGMRLTNLSSGQIPVSSDGNGQITASGLTDDGTFLGINRTIRAWNSLSRSGNTWTDLQWTQDAQERVTMLSSNGSGSGAYHTLAMVHADAEATGRVLGFQVWGQKVSGKSGSNPGVKVDVSVYSVGTGGTIGGFGGQYIIRYRPNNGAGMSTAFRVGAFDGGVVDAVQADILLRANAGFLANYAKIQKDADASVGLDVVGTSGTGKFRMLNSGGGSVLGINAGSLEISCANGIGIGTTAGNASILVSTGDVSIANTYFSSTHRVLPTERNSSASTAIGDRLVVYTGTTNQTESLPAATGSNRVIEFAHASSSGTWTLDAAGTDEIAGELQARVGSIAILPNSAVKQRRLIDFAPGLWVVI